MCPDLKITESIFPALALHYFQLAEVEYAKTWDFRDKLPNLYQHWLELCKNLHLTTLAKKIIQNSQEKIKNHFILVPYIDYFNAIEKELFN